MENQEKPTRQNRKQTPTPQPTKNLKKFSLWKILFLLLLALNIALVAFVAIRVTMPRDSQTLTQQATSSTKSEQVAQISSTTPQVNELINSYLKPYQKDNMSYKFYLSDQEAVLNIDYKILGTKVPIYIYFQPLALADGSVSLSVTSISAGTLSLPTSQILQMVKSYDLPNFVEIKSSSSQVIIHLNQLLLGKNLYLKTNQIDLPNGKFVFDLMKKA